MNSYRLPNNALQGYPAMISAKNIQEYLGVSRATAQRLLERLPHVDVSAPGSKKRLIRVPRAVLLDYLQHSLS